MPEITSSNTILFVDDEERILRSIQRGLRGESYTKYFVNSGKEALDIFKEHEISVLVTDIRMPEMSGLELLKIVKDEYPQTIRIVLTAYAQVSNILAALHTGEIYQYITKPWNLDEGFIPILRQAFEHYNYKMERDSLIIELSRQNEELKKKNSEIKHLKKQAETSAKNKTRILGHLTKDIIPFAADAIQTTLELKESTDPEICEIGTELHNEGERILGRLRKVEDLLNRESHG